MSYIFYMLQRNKFETLFEKISQILDKIKLRWHSFLCHKRTDVYSTFNHPDARSCYDIIRWDVLCRRCWSSSTKDFHLRSRGEVREIEEGWLEALSICIRRSRRHVGQRSVES